MGGIPQQLHRSRDIDQRRTVNDAVVIRVLELGEAGLRNKEQLFAQQGNRVRSTDYDVIERQLSFSTGAPLTNLMTWRWM